MWANFLIAANGACTLGGSSNRLSSPRDRERFHHLRSQARAIVIGGSTFRQEPYRRAPLPLYVATHSASPEMKERNPQAHFYDLTPEEISLLAQRECGDPILVEGGPNFLCVLLQRELITDLFLTRTSMAGDANFFDIDALLTNYRCVESERSNDEVFEVWKLSK